MDDILFSESTFIQRPVKNFVTLVAIKMQGLMNELMESRLLLKMVTDREKSKQSEI